MNKPQLLQHISWLIEFATSIRSRWVHFIHDHNKTIAFIFHMKKKRIFLSQFSHWISYWNIYNLFPHFENVFPLDFRFIHSIYKHTKHIHRDDYDPCVAKKKINYNKTVIINLPIWISSWKLSEWFIELIYMPFQIHNCTPFQRCATNELESLAVAVGSLPIRTLYVAYIRLSSYS